MTKFVDEALELGHDRVRDHSAPIVNQRIADQTRDRIERVVRQGHEAVTLRLDQLDREWDVDRALMVNFAIVGGATYATGLYRFAHSPLLGRRRHGWLQFFTVQLGFLLLHGTVGWCPPLPVFRRLGFRTKSEIEAERRVLLNALPSETGESPAGGVHRGEKSH
jgi:hypothetical protein